MEEGNDPKIITGAFYQPYISIVSTRRYMNVKTSPQG